MGAFVSHICPFFLFICFILFLFIFYNLKAYMYNQLRKKHASAYHSTHTSFAITFFNLLLWRQSSFVWFISTRHIWNVFDKPSHWTSTITFCITGVAQCHGKNTLDEKASTSHHIHQLILATLIFVHTLCAIIPSIPFEIAQLILASHILAEGRCKPGCTHNPNEWAHQLRAHLQRFWL